MFVPYFWESGLIKIILQSIDSKAIIFAIAQFGPGPGPGPYIGASVPLTYSPYLVSPLLGSEPPLQPHHQPHHQQNMQTKQRPERIEVSQQSTVNTSQVNTKE